MHRLNVRILALALILVFTQKLGLRLWMHHWLHETRALSASHDPSVGTQQCDCIDDFLMPLTGSQVIVAPPPIQTASVEITTPTHEAISRETPYWQQRGPPASPVLPQMTSI